MPNYGLCLIQSMGCRVMCHAKDVYVSLPLSFSIRDLCYNGYIDMKIIIMDTSAKDHTDLHISDYIRDDK